MHQRLMKCPPNNLAPAEGVSAGLVLRGILQPSSGGQAAWCHLAANHVCHAVQPSLLQTHASKVLTLMCSVGGTWPLCSQPVPTFTFWM